MSQQEQVGVAIDVCTIFGMDQKQGLVRVTVGNSGVIMDAASARTFGMFLLKCAENAEHETVLFHVLQKRGMSKQQFAVLLADMRKIYDSTLTGTSTNADADASTDVDVSAPTQVPAPTLLVPRKGKSRSN